MKPLRVVLAAALAASCIGPAFAADAPQPPKAAKPPQVSAGAPDAVTHHSISVNGKTLNYTARAGTITLRNNAQEPTARMFYVAYTLDGVSPAGRPVTFFYNGGPGSSTVWLHMASFGPMRLDAPNAQAAGNPPYKLAPNPYTLLDMSDEVFIDAPGTGFGRLIGAGKPKEFYGVDQDAKAFSQFIQSYLTNFNRWNSPKFLFGESYGTTRSAALSSVLEDAGVQLNGIVLQSSILNFDLDWATNFSPVSIGGGDWAYPLYLPSEAAIAWYHNALPNRPANLPAFLQQVQHFAMTEYLQGLAEGAQLPSNQFNDIVNKLHQYTGLSTQYIRDSNLRIQYGRFESQLLRNRGEVVGRLDARYKTYTLDGAGGSPAWDPADVAMTPIFTALFNSYVRNDLQYHPTVPYRIVNYGQELRSWDFKHNGSEPTNVAPDLAQAMTQDPHLHVFSANGYYDLATPYFATVYTLDHLNLNPQLQKNISYGFYQSGHMIYMNTPALAKYKSDLDAWYDRVLR